MAFGGMVMSRAVHLWALLPLLLVTACSGSTPGDDTGTEIIDNDGDGFAADDDCDDDDPSLGSIDQDADCDGTLTAEDCDDTDASLNLADADGDGFSSCDGDCDDDDADRRPDATDGLLADNDCDGETASSLSLADYEFVGEMGKVKKNMPDYAGRRVATAGDVDGDGLDDILIGARGNDDGGWDAGKTYLILGRSLDDDSTIDLSSADYEFVGEYDHDYAGNSVATAGDVDGDGRDDVLVGAYGNDDGGNSAGKACLFLASSLGGDSSIELSSADYEFVGENESDYAGVTVATAGDVDGDGLDDILVGADRNDDAGNSAGKAYLILGSSLGNNPSINLSSADYELVGENDHDYAGSSVATAGDVDGDGLDDILIGAYRNNEYTGKAYLILASSLGGDSTINLSGTDYEFVGENESDYAGRRVAAARDVDGDGLDDILIGARGNDDGGWDAGKAYLILASSLASGSSIDLSSADYEFVGESSTDEAGNSVSTAGDVDGDGLNDILVGAWLHEDGGKTYLILASSLGGDSTIDLSSADYEFVGEEYDDYSDEAGASVSTAGDVNGDGRDDILIGAPNNDDGGWDAGKAYLILNKL